MALRRYVGAGAAHDLSIELQRLAALGMTPAVLREMLVLADDEPDPRRSQLVWSGPEDGAARTRDTGVVLRELFAGATTHVLVAGFAVYQGKSVFKVLSDRMDANPALDVRMFLNIERKYGDTTLASELLKLFADRFRRDQWPGKRLPAVFYDPRSLEPTEKGKGRAALHAKCVVVDDALSFVTSANFTEAAQERNIEVGVLLGDADFARSLRRQFEALVEAHVLLRAPAL
jgi:phosphatidylserine/phosphatidylglycerophosphate/cardiolipin synthase-like enzyme